LDLTLYNTLLRRKEPFRPLDPAHVRMYVCGPTVYDFAHIGNARPVIVFDVLYRLLRRLYPRVTYVRNITDVDDKIMARAAEEGVAIDDLTRRTAEQFHADVAALGCLPPDIEPRATDHIPHMIALIEILIERGHAYEAEGHVLFAVGTMQRYGALSGRSLDEMVAGARVEVAPYKRDPMDFVLWKPCADADPGWDSPWGRGRPGWHIECSAMADRWLWHEVKDTLSDAGLAHPHQFDIHGGGVDLVFPHHENEIAQSTCAHGTAIMAQVWMHNGFLQVEGRKMSKSLGNFVTIRELLNDWPGEVIRLAMLLTHYRQPLDFTRSRLLEAQSILDGWCDALKDATWANLVLKDGSIDVGYCRPAAAVTAALEDDLNTHKAIGAITALARNARSSNDGPELLAHAVSFLGFGAYCAAKSNMAEGFVDGDDDFEDRSLIETLIEARLAARKAKNFAEADRIRDELTAMGVILKDSPDGTTWEVAK
jgi:cysteinyl-tRNA synthetase